MARTGRLELALAGLGSVAVLAGWRLVTPAPAAPGCCDAQEYAAMAAHPGRRTIEPYAARVLLPWTVHLLGGGLGTFRVLTFLCLAGCGPVCYLLARRIGATPASALLAVVALESSPGFVYQLSNPWLSDPATLLLVGAVLLGLVCSAEDVLLAVLLVLLALTREAFVGFALPAFAWWRGPLGPARAARRVAVVLAPACLGYVLVFTLVPHLATPAYQLSVSGIRRALATAVRVRLADDGGYVATGTFVMSLGVWWALAAGAWRSPAVRRLAWWLVPVAATCLLGFDWSRYVLLAYPVVMPAGALFLDATRRRAVAVGLVGLQLFVPLADITAHRMSLDAGQGPSLGLGTVLLLAAVALVGFELRASARRGRLAVG